MTNNLSIFDNMPAHKAVIRNAVPAIVASLMQLVYTLADTFFIGLIRDDLQVAALSVAFPAFMIFMSMGVIFGAGGTSVISRALGEGNSSLVKKVSAFCMWTSVTTGVLISAAFYIFMQPMIRLVGANADTFEYTRSYMMIVSASGPMILIAGAFSNILRADGQPNRAMIGTLLGNGLNIVLDPIFIIGFGMGVRGAATATIIGTTASAAYYLLYFRSKSTALSINPRYFTLKERVPVKVFAIGIPAALGPLIMSFSQVAMNGMMSAYGSFAVAAAGVASKVAMIISTVAMGISQGVQPLFGYAVGSRNWARYRQYLKSSLIFSGGICLLITGVCLIFTRQIVGIFLTETESFNYAVTFAYIFQTTCFMFGIYFVIMSALQGMGAALSALVINVCYQGVIYIPALFLLRSIFNEYGLIAAQPVADVLTLSLSIILHTAMYRKMSKNGNGKSVTLQGRTIIGE